MERPDETDKITSIYKPEEYVALGWKIKNAKPGKYLLERRSESANLVSRVLFYLRNNGEIVLAAGVCYGERYNGRKRRVYCCKLVEPGRELATAIISGRLEAILEGETTVPEFKGIWREYRRR
jgi:hypothetical protein